MAVPPFTYEHPLAPEDVIDREAETERLLDLAASARLVRLTAPRRYGKTSLLLKVLAEADKHGTPGVLVDFYGAVSPAEVAHRLERAYAEHLTGGVRRAAQDFFNASQLGLSLGAMGISAKLERMRNPDPIPALHALMDVPARVLTRKGVTPLVVFDEFQSVLAMSDLDGLMRSHIQFQGGKVAYVFAGSEPGMMRRLFETRSRPLYGQALSERLGRLENADIAVYVQARFAATGRDPGDALAALLDAAAGHPQRAMMLAYFLWQRTSPDGTADDRTWEHAFSDVMRELRDEYRELWRGLDTTHRRALRALAISGQPYSGSALKLVELKKSSAQSAYDRLVDRGELEHVDADEGLRFVDPLLSRWIVGRDR